MRTGQLFVIMGVAYEEINCSYGDWICSHSNNHGWMLVAAQTGAFTSVSTSLQRNEDIRVLHTRIQHTESLTDTFEIEHYTETEMLAPHGPPEMAITDTNQGDAPFKTKLYETYEKLRAGKLGNGVGSGHWPVSDTITSTHHEREVEVDIDIHVLTDTVTHTHHLDDKDEHSLEIHVDDDHHGITSTVGIVTEYHGDARAIQVITTISRARETKTAAVVETITKSLEVTAFD
jgi:hypothetical protein